MYKGYILRESYLEQEKNYLVQKNQYLPYNKLLSKNKFIEVLCLNQTNCHKDKNGNDNDKHDFRKR